MFMARYNFLEKKQLYGILHRQQYYNLTQNAVNQRKTSIPVCNDDHWILVLLRLNDLLQINNVNYFQAIAWKLTIHCSEIIYLSRQ